MDAGHPRQSRFDHLLHELLVLHGDVGHRVAFDRPDQQRRRVLGLPVVAAEHLRLVGVWRQRWQGVETRNDVEHDPRHVGADLETEPHAAAAAIGFGAHLDETRQAAHGLLDRLDQGLFEFGRCRLAPLRVHEELGLACVRQQLDGQSQHGKHAEEQDDCSRGRDGRWILEAAFGEFHGTFPKERLGPCARVRRTPRRMPW